MTVIAEAASEKTTKAARLALRQEIEGVRDHHRHEDEVFWPIDAGAELDPGGEPVGPGLEDAHPTPKASGRRRAPRRRGLTAMPADGSPPRRSGGRGDRCRHIQPFAEGPTRRRALAAPESVPHRLRRKRNLSFWKKPMVWIAARRSGGCAGRKV